MAAPAPGLTGDEQQADSIFALGFTGRVSAVEALLPLLGREEIGSPSGGGHRLHYRLANRQAVREASHALESREQRRGEGRALSVLGADLPKPEPLAIEEWWRHERQKFDPRLSLLSRPTVESRRPPQRARNRAEPGAVPGSRSTLRYGRQAPSAFVTDALTVRQRWELSAAPVEHVFNPRRIRAFGVGSVSNPTYPSREGSPLYRGVGFESNTASR